MRPEFPVRQIVSHKCESFFNNRSFSAFQEHVEELEIKARGNVLIIGAGVWLEELAIIEEDITNAQVTNVDMIGNPALFASQILKAYNQNYSVPLHISGLSYGQWLDARPDHRYDTIIYIGSPLKHPDKACDYLADHLSPSGNLYITDNSFRVPEIPFDIPG